MKPLAAIALSILLVPVSASALDTQRLLAAVAMPLAVAAAADVAGVPQEQLGNLISALNRADVPVVEEVHIIRYVPVALVDARTDRPFVEFVQQQVSSGVTGVSLVPVVTRELQTYYPSQVVVTAPAPRTFVTEEPLIPQTVVTRVAEVRTSHPHGGPPGQIKKQLGLKTGAEVVHGEKRGRQFQPAPVFVNPPMISAGEDADRQRGEGRGHGRGPDGNGPPGQMKAKGGGKGHEKD